MYIDTKIDSRNVLHAEFVTITMPNNGIESWKAYILHEKHEPAIA